MRVLGIDPGYAIVGWGVLDYAGNRFAPVDFGAVCTDAGVPFEQRLDEVYTGIREVIERTQPEVLAIEKLFYQHNQTTVIGVAEARGVILLAAAQAGIPIYEYTPMQVKQAVTGYGKAVKKQVQEMTRILLHLPAVPKPDDTADALAMAITFCHTNGNQLNRFARRGVGADLSPLRQCCALPPLPKGEAIAAFGIVAAAQFDALAPPLGGAGERMRD